MKLYDATTIPSIKKINAMPKKYKAISLFAGMGGASTGLKLAGFDVLYVNEFIEHAADTYELNSNIKVDRRDIRKIKGEDILKRINMKPGELDLLDASPPCKLYSSAAGHSRLSKPANSVVKYSDGVHQRVDDLFGHFIRILKIIQPKVFIAENVKGLNSEKNRGFMLDFVKQMKSAGYNVEIALINASLCGVPQMRQRLVFQGVRKDIKIAPQYPKPRKRHMTLQECFPEFQKVHSGSGGWISALRPCPTITATAYRTSLTSVMSSPGIVRLTNGEDRKLTIPELLTVFSFPSDFRFKERKDKSKIWNEEHAWERMGRTHCPLSVYAVASAISEKILDKIPKNFRYKKAA